MKLQSPLAVITPTVDGDVLGVLAHTSKPVTASEIQSRIGRFSVAGIRKVMVRLCDEGIVRAEPVGNTITYLLNGEHLAAPAIRELADLRTAYVDRLRGHVGTWPVRPLYAALFGSAARGEMTNASDVDIFLVQADHLTPGELDQWEEALVRLQHDASGWTGNDVRSLVMSDGEVRANADSDPVLGAIRAEGIALAGDAGRFWRKIDAENGRVQRSGAARPTG